jgi:predicted dehydrogenase
MVRIGLIGLGKMGISHLAILRAHPDAQLAGVCDASQYVLDILGKYTGMATYGDYRRMIDEARPEAVIVATPSRFHGEMVRYALERGLHVFCEKPFCLDLAEGRALAELAAARNLVNQVGYHYRHVEAFLEAQRLLQAAVLGPVHHVRAEAYGPVVLRPAGSTWRSSKSEGGGCLYDYASHAIDLVHMLVDVPVSISGAVVSQVFSRDVDDEVYAGLHFASGASGQLAANWSDESHRKMSTRVTVWGSNGRMAIDRQECQVYLREAARGAVELPAGWTIRYTTDLIEPVWYYLRGEEYSKQIDAFLQSVQGRHVWLGSTFASALETDRVIRTISSSAGAGAGRMAVDDAPAAAAPVVRKRRMFGFGSRGRRQR